MRLAFLATMFSLLATVAQAGDRIALVIANPQIAKAAPIGADAANVEGLAGWLRSYGYEVTELHAATRSDMLTAMDAFRARLMDGTASLGLFYYVGYAVQSRDENYLLPADFGNGGDMRPPSGIPFKGVAVREFLAGLQGSKGMAVALFNWRTLPREHWSEPFAAFASQEGLATLAMPAGAPIDGDAGNAFVSALVGSLMMQGVTVASMFDDVSRSVAAMDPGRVVAAVGPPSGIPGLAIGGDGGLAPSMSEDSGDASDLGSSDAGGGDNDFGSTDLGSEGSGPPTEPEPGSGGGNFNPDCLSGNCPDTAAGNGGGGTLGSPSIGEPAPEPAPPTDDYATSPAPSTDDYAASPLPSTGDYTTSEEPTPPPPADDGSTIVGAPADDYATAPAPKPAPVPVTPTSPPTEEIVPGGGDGYLDLDGMSDDDAWATAASSNSSAALQLYLSYFPSGKHAQEAYYALSQMDPNFVPPAGAGTANVEVVRHPTMDAPEETAAGETFTVSIALTEEQLTPDVVVKPGDGTTVTPEGALALQLPQGEEWPIDIDLLAAGFDLTDGGAWSRQVTLYRSGDSDFARFEIKARPIRDASKERQLIARLYFKGKFLGSVSRPITVLHEGTAPGGTEASAAPAAMSAPAGLMMASADAGTSLTSDIKLDDRTADDAPDLEVTVNYADPDNLGEGTIYIHSPHIGPPVVAEFTTPPGMTDWLNSEYARLVDLGLKVRGAQPLNAEPAMDAQSQKRFTLRVADGFGRDLYRNYVPDAFKQVFWSLKKEGKLRSIQITSNSPVLPWELVVPESADGQVGGFLGIDYRMARWAPRASAGQVDRPLNQMAFTGVAAVAPAYDHNAELPFQKVEVDALSKLTGFRLVDGDFSSFEKLVGEVSTGFIHFSGHGEVNDPGSGSPVFAIRLLDQELDPTTWRALSFAPRDKGNPFFFFNACDSGQARSLGGFVQGWGPAVLASGASGFIGGMWPLTDRTAAVFSTSFYGDISGQLKSGPVYVAEVLQQVRSQFYETGDPTYLAYTFYGNANLQVVSQ